MLVRMMEQLAWKHGRQVLLAGTVVTGELRKGN